MLVKPRILNCSSTKKNAEETLAPFLSILNQSGILTIKVSGREEITINDQIVASYTQPAIGDSIRVAASADELVFIKVEF